MKILITGATGFVGKKLVSRLVEAQHSLVVISRSAKRAEDHLQLPLKYYDWNPVYEEPPALAFKGIDAVVNLLGEGIAKKRWSQAQKQAIHDSRIIGTKNLVSACHKYLNTPLAVFITASAIGYYPKKSNQILTEETGHGSDFLADVCFAWERESLHMSTCARHVTLRVGIVLGKGGGVLSKILVPFKFGLGGTMGSGKQWMSWIHVNDLVSMIEFSLNDASMNGVYNAVAPHPVTNKEFAKSLGKVIKRPAFISVPAIVLKTMMGEMSTLVLDSQNIQSKKLKNTGFKFKYSFIHDALTEVCSTEL
ncbi:MAG: TIGR01777 family protein [Deltaproteobacteria bacterium]|nr:TIGR01777 family protein [Deltaproteobacteria bacterium]